jgi:excisionase family DNA binding protein
MVHATAAFFMRGKLPDLVAAKGFGVCAPQFAASDPDKGNEKMSQSLESLALRPREAAKALGISPRLLWQLTHDGQIPCVRLGGGKRRTVLYPMATLQAWLAREAGVKKGGDHDPR